MWQKTEAIVSFASEEVDVWGDGGECRPCRAFTLDQMTWHVDDYCCSAEVRGSFQETAPRKTAENTVKHHDGSVGSMVANHCDGGESSVVVTTQSMRHY